jgi:hypothetical protein
MGLGPASPHEQPRQARRARARRGRDRRRGPVAARALTLQPARSHPHGAPRGTSRCRRARRRRHSPRLRPDAEAAAVRASRAAGGMAGRCRRAGDRGLPAPGAAGDRNEQRSSPERRSRRSCSRGSASVSTSSLDRPKHVGRAGRRDSGERRRPCASRGALRAPVIVLRTRRVRAFRCMCPIGSRIWWIGNSSRRSSRKRSYRTFALLLPFYSQLQRALGGHRRRDAAVTDFEPLLRFRPPTVPCTPHRRRRSGR